jgi:hypothetical protein
MIELSTGLRNHCLSTGSFKAALDGGKMYWYSGAKPADADAAIDGAQVLLVTISDNGGAGGLTFAAAAAAGVLAKLASQTWTGTVVADGLAAFFRFVEAGDDPLAASTTAKRFQGTISTTGADINLVDPNLVTSDPNPVDSFNVTLPAV